ncbi:integral membrane protein, partial [Podospora aff. communis PSN243]
MSNATAPALDPNANNAYLVYIPSAVFVVICPILMGLRIWVRLRKGGKLGSDDWTAIVALIFTILTEGFLVASCQYGMGRHWATINKANRFETQKYFFMAQVTYKAAINLVKCCILLLYLRLFQVVRWFRIASWSLLAIVAIYCTASIAATIFQCTPVIRAFDKDTPGHCLDTAKFWFANAGFSIATDIIILLLPMPLVWKLEVPRTQKFALVAIFTVGIFVVITSCQRVTTLDLFATSPDHTYNIENVMWTIIEPNVAVVCSCLPILRPLVVKFIPGLRSKSIGKYHGSYDTGGSAPGYFRQGSGTGKQGSGAEKSRATMELPRGENRPDWVELSGVKSPQGLHRAAVHRPSSQTGSEEDMLVMKGSKGSGVGPGGVGVQRTVEYSVQYSKER